MFNDPGFLINGLVPSNEPDPFPVIDVVFPLSHGGAVLRPVVDSLSDQEPALIRSYEVQGPKQDPGIEDPHERKLRAIVATRNLIIEQSKEGLLGDSPFLMMVDYDIPLMPGAVYQVYRHLFRNHRLAVAAIDCQSSMDHPEGSIHHVGFGAWMVRRDDLHKLTVRWDAKHPELCECLYAADDLRKMGRDVEYAPSVAGAHIGAGTGFKYFNSQYEADEAIAAAVAFIKKDGERNA